MLAREDVHNLADVVQIMDCPRREELAERDPAEVGMPASAPEVSRRETQIVEILKEGEAGLPVASVGPRTSSGRRSIAAPPWRTSSG